MPEPGSGSRRSSKSALSQSERQKQERRERAKSIQSYTQPRKGPDAARPATVASPRPEVPGSHAALTNCEQTRPHRASDQAGASPGPRYTTAQQSPTSPSTRTASENVGDPDDVQDTRLAGDSPTLPAARSPDLEPMAEINIGVLGAAGVGKTTFVEKAFGLQTSVSSSATGKTIPINGKPYMVRLLEIPFDDIEVEEDARISWPVVVNDQEMSPLDGALALYDVMNKDSLADIPKMLHALSRAALPCVLVSCKCDVHPTLRQIDPATIEQKARLVVSGIDTVQTSNLSSDSHRQCVSTILQAIFQAKQGQTRDAAARHRATTSAVSNKSPPPTSQSGHNRAQSEYSGSTVDSQVSTHIGRGTDPCSELRPVRQKSQRSAQKSFLNLDESASSGSSESEGHSSTSVDEPDTHSETPPDEKGYSFDNLVDRLLAQPMSKTDSKFAAIFLALYRKFAAPCRLLESIIRRFEALDRDACPHMVKTVSQLRHLAIMEQWVNSYPGDFAHPWTHRNMRLFVDKIGSNRIYAVAAKEMGHGLAVADQDDDTDRAFSDKTCDCTATIDTTLSSLSSVATLSDGCESDVLSGPSDLELGHKDPHPGTLVTVPGSTSGSTSGSSSSSSQTMLNAVESAQRQAQSLTPTSQTPCSKVQWHQLMEIPEEIIAKELTRIDWVMFSSMRPRDLVRHVSMNAQQKQACKNLENVDRMISHFNHLAYWVANFVLLRDKPKHRALMLEKLMRVARKLRELNNYNALGALLAGINGIAVHRLAATRELIPPAVAKDFMKLEILMGSQKSHFAYRLAWENSSSERIPYLPLHRRDLVSAEAGNRTFVGDGGERVNWKKFEIMGEVILALQKAQGTPYPPMTKNEDVRMLVLDCKLVKDDDDLYDRSTQVEPAAGAGAADTRRGFRNFFQR
ncbi:ras guanine nucleotide exchange factor domain-containing protein [Cryomyces antarcticus]